MDMSENSDKEETSVSFSDDDGGGDTYEDEKEQSCSGDSAEEKEEESEMSIDEDSLSSLDELDMKADDLETDIHTLRVLSTLNTLSQMAAILEESDKANLPIPFMGCVYPINVLKILMDVNVLKEMEEISYKNDDYEAFVSILSNHDVFWAFCLATACDTENIKSYGNYTNLSELIETISKSLLEIQQSEDSKGDIERFNLKAIKTTTSWKKENIKFDCVEDQFLRDLLTMKTSFISKVKKWVSLVQWYVLCCSINYRNPLIRFNIDENWVHRQEKHQRNFEKSEPFKKLSFFEKIFVLYIERQMKATSQHLRGTKDILTNKIILCSGEFNVNGTGIFHPRIEPRLFRDTKSTGSLWSDLVHSRTEKVINDIGFNKKKSRPLAVFYAFFLDHVQLPEGDAHKLASRADLVGYYFSTFERSSKTKRVLSPVKWNELFSGLREEVVVLNENGSPKKIRGYLLDVISQEKKDSSDAKKRNKKIRYINKRRCRLSEEKREKKKRKITKEDDDLSADVEKETKSLISEKSAKKREKRNKNTKSKKNILCEDEEEIEEEEIEEDEEEEEVEEEEVEEEEEEEAEEEEEEEEE